MKKELIDLINKSKALSKEKKQTYLKAIEFLSDSKVNELFALLKKEQEALQKIEIERNVKKTKLNKAYTEEIEEIYSSGMKSGISKTEEEEKKDADNLLKEIE